MMSLVKNSFTKILSYLGLWRKRANIVILGLDYSGKTTLMHMMRNNRFSYTSPTGHTYSEELRINNIRLNTFDLGGHETIRKRRRDYIPYVHGIVFIADASDVMRFAEAKKELQNVVDEPELEGIPICVLGNKIDKSSAVLEQELREALDLDSIKNRRPSEVFMCSVIKKIGYSKGLEWLTNYIK